MNWNLAIRVFRFELSQNLSWIETLFVRFNRFCVRREKESEKEKMGNSLREIFWNMMKKIGLWRDFAKRANFFAVIYFPLLRGQRTSSPDIIDGALDQNLYAMGAISHQRRSSKAFCGLALLFKAVLRVQTHVPNLIHHIHIPGNRCSAREDLLLANIVWKSGSQGLVWLSSSASYH